MLRIHSCILAALLSTSLACDTRPKDILGVSETQPLIQILNPDGDALKVKLKVVVLPAGPPVE